MFLDVQTAAFSTLSYELQFRNKSSNLTFITEK